MTKTVETVDELRAKLAQAEQAETERVQKEAEALKAAQLEWAQGIMGRAGAIEAELSQSERDASQAAMEAAVANDITEAYSQWASSQAMRSARGQLRTAEQSAAHMLDVEPSTAAELRTYRDTFADFLERVAPRRVSREATEIVDKLLPVQPGFEV